MDESILRDTVNNSRLGQDACWVLTGQVEEGQKGSQGPVGGSVSIFLETQVWPWDVMASTWLHLGPSQPLGIRA